MNLNGPLVSVIVPCYNHEKFVEQAINSVLNQTYENIELIVIDDGSKDNSPLLLQQLSEKHHFYFVQQENKGTAITLNKYIEKSKGKYISILASDDVWLLDKIEKQVKHLEQNPKVGANFGNVLSITAKNEILPFYLQRFSNYGEYNFKDLLSLSAPLSALTNMLRKDALDKVGLFDKEFLLEDLYMWLKLAHADYTITVLPDLLGFYRVHGNNTSKQNKLMYHEKLKLLNVYKGKKGYWKGIFKTHLHYCMHVVLGLVPKALLPFKRS